MAVAVAFLAALLLLAGCVPPSGRVVSHQERFSRDGRSYLLCTQRDNGPVKCGQVDLKVWRACDVGDYYDQDLCDSRGKR